MAVEVVVVGVDVFIGKDDGATGEASFDGVHGRFGFAFFGAGSGTVLCVGAVGVAAGLGGFLCLDFVDEVLEVEGVGRGWLVGAAADGGGCGHYFAGVDGQFLGLALSSAALCTIWHISRFPFRKYKWPATRENSCEPV